MSILPDTQNEIDSRQIAIERVGIRELRYPLSWCDVNGAVQSTVATCALSVHLPAEQRGTHMSRFVQTLHDFLTAGTMSAEKLSALGQSLLSALQSRAATVELVFPFFISKKAPSSGATGLLDAEVHVRIDAHADTTPLTEWQLRVPVATLCPCSKAISDRGAHNQRGMVTLRWRSASAVALSEIIAVMEQSASCALFSVLKRDDEKMVTEQAYDNPVFVEDVVRNLAQRCDQDPRLSWYRIEAENFESIHHHNAYALVLHPSERRQ